MLNSKKIIELLDQLVDNIFRPHSKLIGQTFEVWLNSVNHPDKIARIVTVDDVDPASGMIYLRKVANAPKIGEKITVEPGEFEGWVHPMNVLALTPYTEEMKYV